MDKLDPRGQPNAASWEPEGFVRLPPGMSLPSIRAARGADAGPARRLGMTIDDYRHAHRVRVMGMLSMQSSPPIPPGHPLYAQNATLGALREENALLKAENARLREEKKKGDSEEREPRLA